MYIDNQNRQRNNQLGEEDAIKYLSSIGIKNIEKNNSDSFKNFDFFGEVNGKKIRIEYQTQKSFQDLDGIFIPIKSHKIFNLNNDRFDLLVNVYKSQICLIYTMQHGLEPCKMEDYISSMKEWGESKDGFICIPDKIFIKKD